jgi:hypothetical protein
MASLLDGIQFLKEFGIYTTVMPFLLIFSITYGFLLYIKPFGEDTNTLNSIIAFSIAFMALQFMPLMIFLQLIVPYLFGLFLIIMLVWILFKFMGVSDDTLAEATGNPSVYGIIIAVVLIGVFVFMSESFPALDTQNQGDNTGGISSGLESNSGSGLIVTESDSGTTTVIPDSEVKESQDLLQKTIFHPTMLSVMVLFITFGVAAYFVTVVKVIE